jgi:hypothetical protein
MRVSIMVATLAAFGTLGLGTGGCGDGSSTKPDGGQEDGGARDAAGDGPATAFAVTSVSPAVGPLAGGTQVVVSGRGFESGATVSFGTNAGVQPLLLSAFQIKVTTPAATGPGKVAVTVRLTGGTTATLQSAFEYVAPIANAVDWCTIQWPASTTSQPGAATEPIFGRVFEQGCTDGNKKCEAMKAEAGYGPSGTDPSSSPSSFTWLPATYNASHTEDDNDEYSATLSVAAEGTYAYAYRFSLDEGATWTYCDLDGSGNGLQTAQLGALTVSTQSKSIGWCALKWPAVLPTTPGGSPEPVFGQLFVDGCTPGTDQCVGVNAELGFGPIGLDPSTDPSVFTWVTATFNASHPDDNNDEYQATFSVTQSGTYGYAYRFSSDGGGTWKYCDLDGSDNGFQTSQLGRLTVGAPRVDWCGVQHPPATSTSPGVPTETIFGQVYVAGCTDGAAQCANVEAQLGYGPANLDPSALPSAYTWADAAYNFGHTGDNNDEYQLALTIAGEATLAYAFRFSLDGGATWTYCDLDGSFNGIQLDQLGALTVAKPTVGIDWCTLQWPASTSAKPGQATEPIFGQVYVGGCTEGAAQCGGITAELGYGPTSVDPSTTPASYTWTAAAYNAAHTDDNNDEYSVTLTVAAAGDYGYAYRFSRDGGSTWSYCDTDGSSNGFERAKAGQLSVETASLSIGWCNLQSPASTGGPPGGMTETIYGRVYVGGCTDGAAHCTQVKAQVGLGSPSVNPQTSPDSYLWQDAAYNAGHTGDNNDEYGAALTPTTSGTYAYAYRFSVDDGVTWSYCDRDGSTNGLQTDQLGVLTVSGRTITWCNVQWPTTISLAPNTSTGLIYGQVLVTGCTDGTAQCPGLRSQLGYGARAANPSTAPESYAWVEATYNTGVGDNDEYEAALTPAPAGSYGYAYRFSGDGGASWTYCDTTGTPFAAADVGQLTVQ